MRRTIFTENFNTFDGSGLAADPAAGQLDSDLWGFTGFGSADDLSRGIASGPVGTGGVYAVEVGLGDYGLLIQPGGSDFTPGTVTLTLETGPSALSDVVVAYELLVRNDQPRANSFDLAYSVDGGAFTRIAPFITTEAPDADGLRNFVFNVTIPQDIAAGSTLVLQWTGDDVRGGGARDEVGLDNIRVDGLETDAPPAPGIVINEVLASTTGADSEYIELYGTPGASLAGLSLIEVEAADGLAGAIDFRFDFADDAVLGDNGFLLLANAMAQATYGVTANVTLDDSLENSAVTYALVRTDSLSGDDVTGAETVIDTVASDDGAAGNTFYFGAPVVGPDGTFFPAGLGRITDGLDTDSASDFRILSFGNDPAVNTPTAGTGLGGGGGGGGGGTIDDPATLISAIQGTGDDSPLVGQQVVVEAIVTGDFQNGDGDPTRDLGGFFVMEELADRDGDAASSEGLWIYEGFAPTAMDVSGGDLVRLLGTVTERFGKTTLEVTEIRVVTPGAVDPASLAVETALPDADAREALENMLVTISEPLTFTESFDYENFGVATLSTDGPVYQYTQQNAPDAAGNAAYQDQIRDRTILIEDGLDGRRDDFDPILQPDGTPFTFGDGVRMGQSVDDLTGIVDFSFGEYRLRLPEDESFDLNPATNPPEGAPQDVGSSYKAASLNVLNYFTTLSGRTDIGASPRGADSAEELARQTDKLVSAILGMDADVIGLTEIENDFAGDSFALQTLVNALNDELDEDVWAYVDPGRQFVGDDAIAVAFIYDTTTTRTVGGAAILDDASFLDPLGPLTSGDSYNRAALAQTFEDIDGGGIFTASINHLKSKGSLTGADADTDQGDGAGNNNATRAAAAQQLADWLATDPTGSGDADRLILGDLNAYAMEEPLQVLEAAGYSNLAAVYEGDDVYSYRFSGQIGTLDYALANGALLDQVTGATTWNINSDTPVFFDYNLDGTFVPPLRPLDQGLFDGGDPARSSDHDPVIVGLDLDDDSGPLVLMGTTGADRLNGTDADEIVMGLGGPLDVVTGGGGADTFVFGDLEGARDTLRILDFDTDADMLDLAGADIASTRVLGGNLLIQLEDDRDTIFLAGISDFGAVQIVDGLGLA
ncbi:putative endonuclease/exonuclease/phosphatase [Oceaniovalibus guishaninsula JLT2003]|uniref:Putative endonuclease/exonuclease/phosphatase n=1 Tax=Oceaniovalibus guishaninsula JLT2003 TaxID=1231392 RepID=K2GMI9_9RHOB|nr:ExeM/NucH family extracellular endonuclease [Oceaniovalibus guishaninsula]EKE43946.1 putative endonuclease/exonuclease/phosphatase [Oceaniovalibus guishaninsula JLT2003]